MWEYLVGFFPIYYILFQFGLMAGILSHCHCLSFMLDKALTHDLCFIHSMQFILWKWLQSDIEELSPDLYKTPAAGVCVALMYMNISCISHITWVKPYDCLATDWILGAMDWTAAIYQTWYDNNNTQWNMEVCWVSAMSSSRYKKEMAGKTSTLLHILNWKYGVWTLV